MPQMIWAISLCQRPPGSFYSGPMQKDLTIENEAVVIDRDALTRQARATLLRTLRNAEVDLREKATSRPIPEERSPLLRLFGS
jgi:hypothetical protein